jgi:ribosome-binding ATPase YchF (GTP1/OBG family)
MLVNLLLFNALTKSYAADAGNFPFCTIEPNVGIVDVKDIRLETLSKISNTQKIVYATTSFVDIAGLVKWASSGEWLGNKFLSHIREVDVIVQVLRYFQNPDVSHVEWSVDPLRDCRNYQYGTYYIRFRTSR